ncbi:glutamine amidotransferase [Terrihabitans soli]|uniref:Glutamine amidotransferase n=1 Tax=Terrihabitans soli TaxID=708113 RepID=A0A6S6QN68_9HYPH|nr:type 1 glutamine amidotransferase [Terrihabitans soli]BCJ90399.1 glutamine amidotransferase [Terrihabitans soli]
MKILAINSSAHMTYAEAGTIARVAEEKGAVLDWWNRGSGPLPEAEGYAALILFGGEMSVHDPVYRDYFDAVAALVHAFHEANRPVLGSCLGAQILAHAFGSKVYQGPVEYGFARLTLTEDGKEDALLSGLNNELDLFEMHGDTFDLPQDAVLLARGAAVPHQIFRMGNATYGFQCHFEVTPDIVEEWSSRHSGTGDRITPLVARDRPKVREDLRTLQDSQVSFAETVMTRWLELAAL